MVTMERVRVPWTGGIGGAGLSTFYFTNAATALPHVRQFFFDNVGMVAAGITWEFPGTGDKIDSSNGKIVGTWNGTGEPLVQSTGSGSYSGASGYMVTWTTDSVIDGHRVRGRTFMVPGSNVLYDAQGSINDTLMTQLNNAASTLLTTVPGNLQVWSRPVKATPQWTDVHGRLHAAVAARIGQSVTASGVIIRDKAVVLRSRRD